MSADIQATSLMQALLYAQTIECNCKLFIRRYRTNNGYTTTGSPTRALDLTLALTIDFHFPLRYPFLPR
jgi:hypothetical protein